MNASPPPFRNSPEMEVPKRRTNDFLPETPDKESLADPEGLFAEFRSGKVKLESIAHLIPVWIAFQWHSEGKVSSDEFAILIGLYEVEEVSIAESKKHQAEEAVEMKAEKKDVRVEMLENRMAHFENVFETEIATVDHFREVFRSKTIMKDWIGIRLSFEKTEEDPNGGKKTTKDAIVVKARAYSWSRSKKDTIKCEAVISGQSLKEEFYCRIYLPLPIHKGGRRRLFVSVLDSDTWRSIHFPDGTHEIFQERNLAAMTIIRKDVSAIANLSSMVKWAFWRIFSK